MSKKFELGGIWYGWLLVLGGVFLLYWAFLTNNPSILGNVLYDAFGGFLLIGIGAYLNYKEGK